MNYFTSIAGTAIKVIFNHIVSIRKKEKNIQIMEELLCQEFFYHTAVLIKNGMLVKYIIN